MFGMEILDVAIGIILVYFLLSLISAAVREGIEGIIKSRAVHLERGIRELLDDEQGVGFARYLYEHPLIYSLYRGRYVPEKKRRFGRTLPTYIPARNFAVAVIDLTLRGPVPGRDDATRDPYAAYHVGEAPTVDALREAATRIGSPLVQRSLLAAIDNSQGSVERVQANLQAWFDSAMDSVSGAYKRRTQLYLFSIALVTTVALNANTITLANHLARNASARESLVRRAQLLVDDTTYRRLARDTSAAAADARARFDDLASLDLPIGWDRAESWPGAGASLGARFSWWARSLVGLILTAFAVTLGAPFWFDVLNKIMVIRSTVKPREKSGEEGSEDRAATRAAPPAPAGGATPLAAGVTRTMPSPATPPATTAGVATVPTVPATVPVVEPPFEAQTWAEGAPEEGIL